jgi:hypothetical protein
MLFTLFKHKCLRNLAKAGIQIMINKGMENRDNMLQGLIALAGKRIGVINLVKNQLLLQRA